MIRSPFLELSQFAGFGMYEEEVPAGGIHIFLLQSGLLTLIRNYNRNWLCQRVFSSDYLMLSMNTYLE